MLKVETGDIRRPNLDCEGRGELYSTFRLIYPLLLRLVMYMKRVIINVWHSREISSAIYHIIVIYN